MNKLLKSSLALSMIFGLCACSSTQEEPKQEANQQQEEVKNEQQVKAEGLTQALLNEMATSDATNYEGRVFSNSVFAISENNGDYEVGVVLAVPGPGAMDYAGLSDTLSVHVVFDQTQDNINVIEWDYSNPDTMKSTMNMFKFEGTVQSIQTVEGKTVITFKVN